MDRPDILNLSIPRYVPFILKGALLAVWHDRQEDQYVVLCPRCHQLIAYDQLAIVYREFVWSERRCCQGCRAKISFEQAPNLLPVFADFWYRTGNFPDGPTWLDESPDEHAGA